MRKIYSLVLMAAALLIGTNVWAENEIKVDYVAPYGPGHTYSSNPAYFSDLQEAVNSILEGDSAMITIQTQTLELSNAIVIPDVRNENPVVKSVANRLPQRICLNLAGNKIQTSSTQVEGCLLLLKGTLHVTGGGTIWRQGVPGSFSNISKAAIAVFGTDGNKTPNTDPYNYPDRSQQLWSQLIIDNGVTVKSDVDGGIGITIHDIGTAGHGKNGNDFPNLIGSIDQLGYFTYNRRSGITNQNQVDPMWFRAGGTEKPDEQGAAFGVKIIVGGEVYGTRRGINMVGHINQHPNVSDNGEIRDDDGNVTKTNTYPFYVHYYPYIQVLSTAVLHCQSNGLTDGGNGGIYAGGWAVWDIRGTVYGQTGIYIAGGDVNIKDATIYSDSPDAASDGNYGGNVAGNAIFIKTDVSYAQDIDVNVEGDSKITGKGGAAIVDVVATNAQGQPTGVNHFDVTGGTIEAGNQGAIALTGGTADKTTIYGGSVEGVLTVDNDEENISEIMTDNGFITTTTNEDGKTVIVISNTGESTGSITWTQNFAATNGTEYVALTSANSDCEIGDGTPAGKVDANLAYLKMDAGAKLTVKANSSLTVGEVVLNWTNNNTPADDSDDSFAKIIVEPGGKLIVTGDKGIYSPKEECLLIQATEENPGIFMFKPSVSSNKNPKGKVEFVTKSYRVSSADRYNQRFGLPTIAAVSEIATNPVGVDAAFMTFNYSTRAWETAGFINHGSTPDMDPGLLNTPFEYYQLLCNVAKGSETTFTFAGSLVGNNNPSKTIDADTWYGIANSYTANMDLEAIVTNFSGNIAKTIWTYEANGSASWGWSVGNMATLALDGINKIKPMQAFLIRNANTTEAETMTLDYAKTVWNPVMGAGNAPARQTVSSSWTTAKMTVADEEGLTDCIYLVRDNQFSTDYDNGYDAEKYMNNNINLYISDDQAMSVLATNDLTDTYIGFACVTGGTYTISFNRINGETFDLIDLETNAIVHMSEGATYQFYANDNETNDYRFKVVTRQEMPTEVETVENVSNKQGGVYTLTGQYLGEMNVWNSLPAGLYIVNGEKKVK